MKIDDGTLTLEESVYLSLSEEILSGELTRGHALTESLHHLVRRRQLGTIAAAPQHRRDVALCGGGLGQG